jgi:hypothetical protein
MSTKAKKKGPPSVKPKPKLDLDKHHSYEPWQLVTRPYEGWRRERDFDFLGEIHDRDGAEIYHGPASFRALVGNENARRIVACVNALAGVPTSQLESVKTGQLAPVVNAVLGLILPTVDLALWPFEYDGYPARAVGTHPGCRLGTSVVMLVKCPGKRYYVCGCDLRLRDEEIKFDQ